jgi:predicted phosphodiesterase
VSVRSVAALYDVHANLPALDAVLAEVETLGPDVIVVGGDAVSGPMPVETLDRLSAFGDRVRWVRGNADREAVEAFDTGKPSTAFSDVAERAAAWTATQLTKDHRDLVARFEERVVLEVEDLGAVLFCHGSPRSDEEIITSVTTDERLAEILDGVAEPTVVCGHTHRQFDRVAGRHRVVNAGSVGMPYEGDAAAFWLAVGPEIELRRTTYDVEAAAAAMRATGFPDVDEIMLRETLLEPADPDWVAEFFEARATGAEPPPEPTPT